MKKVLFLLIAVFLFGGDLKINSLKFYYDSAHLKSVFTGNVKAVKDKDEIQSDKLVIYFSKEKKPTKIVALGNVRFKFNMDQNSTYVGKCDELTYYVPTGDIILTGHAFIKKVQTNEIMKGEKIKINKIKKPVEAVGNKNKPVNIIIKVEE